MKIIGETTNELKPRLLVEMTREEFDAITGGDHARFAKNRLEEAIRHINAAFPIANREHTTNAFVSGERVG